MNTRAPQSGAQTRTLIFILIFYSFISLGTCAESKVVDYSSEDEGPMIEEEEDEMTEDDQDMNHILDFKEGESYDASLIPRHSMFSQDEPIVLGLSEAHARKILISRMVQGRGFIDSIVEVWRNLYKLQSAADKTDLKNQIMYHLKVKTEDKSRLQPPRDDLGPHWDKGVGVTILIHGLTPQIWVTSAVEKLKAQYWYDIGDALQEANPNNNIVIVDWTSLSTYNPLQYYEAADSAIYAGNDIGNFILNLVYQGNTPSFADIHLIGFSLGAHAAGVAGYRTQWAKRGTVGRITGLDPAGPLFSGEGEEPPPSVGFCLDPSDATYVDVIHCNMGTFFDINNLEGLGALGTPAISGTIDFYPNGGEHQPGCSEWGDKLGCSHGECLKLFYKSIKEKLLACPCWSYWSWNRQYCHCTEQGIGGTYLGYHSTFKARNGKHYLNISAEDAFPGKYMDK